MGTQHIDDIIADLNQAFKASNPRTTKRKLRSDNIIKVSRGLCLHGTLIKEMTKINSYQDYQGIFTVGYVYLVILGLLNQTIYYSQLGIGILKYSSISDILLGPFDKITSSPLGIFLFILTLLLAFIAPPWLAKRKDKKWIKNSFKINTEQADTEILKNLQRFILFFLALGLFGFFTGIGVGKGLKKSSQISNKTIEYKDHIHFVEGSKKDVHLLGSNSYYLFYLLKGNEDIQITPIHSGVIKSFSKEHNE